MLYRKIGRMEQPMRWVKDAVGYWCEDIYYRKYLGQGVGVAVLDTGIMPHPDFGNRIIGFSDFVSGRTRIYDDSGHGTHVSGILAGNGKMSGGVYAGIAPEASLLIAKVLDHSGNGTVESVLHGIEWILAVQRRMHLRIVNISVGTQPGLDRSEEERLLRAVEMLWDAGLIVVVSAGNYGPKAGTVAVPGSSRKVITVGAVDISGQRRRRARKRWDYSGRGPTAECVIKPDIVAPGTSIASCNSTYRNRFQSPYTMKSGTSMATPVVSGAIACLLSKYPDMTNVEVKLKLRESSIPADYTQGWGMLHIGRLLESREMLKE